MNLVYKRSSPTEPVEAFKFDGPTTVHSVLWPIENNPHVGVLLVTERIHMCDGTSGTALLIDLKRHGKPHPRSFIVIGLLDGDVEYTHTLLSLMFNIPPAVTPLFTLPGKKLSDLNSVLDNLDDTVFSLESTEIGNNCVSIVNDIICHYTNSRVRYRLRLLDTLPLDYRIESIDES